ncbi:MAG: cell division protein FtsZ [Candidatus Thermoplasmatota archaeon]|nr:cell division protein FtsZ [Candidatus Thermoplasmatota archaeon]
MPKSLVKDALGKDVEELLKKPSKPSEPEEKKPSEMSADDEEIAKIAAQLDVSIRIIGCGGGGSNTIDRCVEAGVSGAQLCAINTDAKHLLAIHAPKKILIGKNVTRGLGAGAIPHIGEAAAKENERDIHDFLDGANIVFVTAGMGGGTGTGSAHFAARLSKDLKALTIGVVTLPFKAEGEVRMETALDGLEKLRRLCDTTIVIPNDKLLELVPKLPVDAAFKVADEVLMQTIRGLTEIITKPGLVNLDYSDIMTVMNEGGVAFVGIGESDDSDAEERIQEAIDEALSSPLLGEIDLKNARGALIRVVGGPDMTVSEAQKAAEAVGERINKHARIIWGCSVDPDNEGQVRILLIVTGAKSALLMGSGGDSQNAVAAAGGSAPKSFTPDDDGIDFVH